jgi:hypothetical protein
VFSTSEECILSVTIVFCTIFLPSHLDDEADHVSRLSTLFRSKLIRPLVVFHGWLRPVHSLVTHGSNNGKKPENHKLLISPFITFSFHFENFTWPVWPLWNICITNDHGYVPLVVNISRSFPHSRLITGFVTRLTRWVPLVEQELLTLPEHLCYSSFSFMCMFCRSLFFLLYFFFWPLLCLFFDIQILMYPLVFSNSSADTMSLYSLSNQSFLKSTINENEEEGNAITHGLSTMNVISTS